MISTVIAGRPLHALYVSENPRILRFLAWTLRLTVRGLWRFKPRIPPSILWRVQTATDYAALAPMVADSANKGGGTQSRSRSCRERHSALNNLFAF